MIRCIIIEDQPPAQRILKKYIEDTPELELKEVFSNAISGGEYLNENEIDLIFLDIHLPKISGLDFLKSQPKHPMVILTTAFPDYALESYQFNVVDYLLKPFSYNRFLQSISKINTIHYSTKTKLNNHETLESETLLIKSGYDVIKLNRQDIVYIHSDADYTEIVTNSKKYLSTYRLKYWNENLGDSFSQVHKSYLVNMQQVERVTSTLIVTKNGNEIPIGRAYKKSFLEVYR